MGIFASSTTNTKVSALQQPAAAILEKMTDAFIALDPDWRITHVNQATARANQVLPQDLVGRSLWDVWPALVGTICEQKYRQAIAEQVPVHFDFFYEPRQQWDEIHAYPSLQGLEIYCHNIDDRKHVENERRQADATLQAKEEQLRLALDLAQIGSWSWDLSANQVEWNEIHFFLLGLNPGVSTVAYDTWRERVHPEDVGWVEALVRSALATQTSYEAEYRVCYPDGSIHWVSGRGQAIYDSLGQPRRMMGVLMDITDRKLAEQERERLLAQEQLARQEAERLNALKDEYLTALQQYKDIFQFTEHGLAVGQGTQIQLANPAFARMHGYAVEEMIGKPILELFPSTHQVDGIRSLQQSEQVGNLTFESVHVRRDSSQFPILLNVTAVKDDQGQTLYRIATILDITQQKRLEGERQQAETEVLHLNQRLRQLVQAIQQLASARDLQAITAAVRSAARRLVGADGSAFVLREGEFCYYADEEAIAPLWRGQRFPVKNCISGWVMLNRMPAVIPDIFSDDRIPQEYYRPTFVRSLAMLPIHSVEPIGAIGVYWATEHLPTTEEVNLLQTLADAAAIALQNVRLYTQLEQRVQERTTQLVTSLSHESTLKRITDKVRDSLDEMQILQTVVQELTNKLDIYSCNTALYDLEQRTSTIRYGHGCCELRVTQGEMSQMEEHAFVYTQLLRGKYVHCCLALQTPGCQRHTFYTVLVCPLVDDQGVLGDIWLIKAADQSFSELEIRLVQQVANQCAIGLRQSRLYQAAQAQVIALEQLSQLKDEFLSTVSHELRSPMATIKMVAKMLEVAFNLSQTKQLTVTPDEMVLSSGQIAKVTHYVKILNYECQREAQLIDDLLDLARLDARTETLSPMEVHLQEWLPLTAQSFAERMNQQQLQLQIQVSSYLPPLITDLPSLERIVMELIHNACKYTPSMETIEVTAIEHLEGIKISVSNSGIEIPTDLRDQVFDKFYRIPNHDPWKRGGTGLGLALSKKLVELLQGSISLTSENNWTRFTVFLPQSLQ
ncbi:PAS domain S-box protein [Trichocoleus desertorum AS-A10]|uniref:PAS domain S-box protein n=1 Tax=Trichocoleus desertorum TaxID=1481672 RepID=UPI00329A33BF